MAIEYFHSECVISGIDIEFSKSTDGKKICSAIIDGREVDNLVLSSDAYKYLTGIGRGSKNKIYFIKKKKQLIAYAIKNSDGDTLVEKITAKHYAIFAVFMPAVYAWFAWIAAWPVLGILVLLKVLSSRSVEEAALLPAVVCFIWFARITIRRFETLKKFESWPTGDVSKYTKAVFGMKKGSTATTSSAL